MSTVFDEYTGEERAVVGHCAVCGVEEKHVMTHKFLLSPNGTAHLQSRDIPENTVCGHDATRDGWWWPL